VSQPKLAKNSLKLPILGVQGHSRKVIDVDTPKLVTSDKQHVCAYLPQLSC